MEVPVILFAVAFVTVAGFFITRLVKYGSFRGALYGARVIATFGDVEVQRNGSTATSIRVHALEDGRIVLEQSTRALLAYRADGIPMGPIDADRLIHYLQQARATPTP